MQKIINHSHNFIDKTNNKFYRLFVLKIGYKKKNRIYWECICDCGNIVFITSDKLNNGHTKSCGCIRKELMTKHSMSKTRFYRIWHTMKTRCGKDDKYFNIKYSKRWNKFDNFYSDMYEAYNIHVKKHGIRQTTIDRINSKGNYTKNNCRWATYKVQNNNISRNKYCLYNNKKYTPSQLFDLLNPVVNTHCFSTRILSLKWDIDVAANKLNTHIKK